VVDKHFAWMQQYGIDGAALQRFGSDIAAVGQARLTQRNSIQSKARDAAQKYGRGFYIEYDLSGLTDANMVSTVQNDWTNTITGTLQLTNSPSYAREAASPWSSCGHRRHQPARHHSEQPGAHQLVQEQGRLRHRRGAARLAHGLQRQARLRPRLRRLNMVSPWNVGNPLSTSSCSSTTWPS